MDSFKEADYEKQREQAQASFDKSFCLKMSQRIASAEIMNQLNLPKAYQKLWGLKVGLLNLISTI